jgi:RND superfamily putative drug exporter
MESVLGHDDVTYYVPFAAAVLLLSLGSDYNVFVVGRIWQSARERPLREAIAETAPRTSATVTTAGITLAGSFALLALIPLRAMRELALAMALGILLDTFVVRSVLVPSLLALFRRREQGQTATTRP